MGSNGQVFSLDLIIAVVVFIATFLAFYGFITYILVEPEEKVLARESEHVATAIGTAGKQQVIGAQQLQLDKLIEIGGMPEEEHKHELGVKNDFCLYLEDEQGNLVVLPTGKTSIGNEKAVLRLSNGTNVQEIPCGQTLSPR